MNFTYTTGIPAASHNLSDDQPPMQVNTNSISGIIAIDHYGFDNDLGGDHKQVTFPQASPTPTATGSIGILYTTNPGSGPSVLNFINSAGNTQLTGPGLLLLRAGTGSFGTGISTVTISYTAFPTAALACIVSPYNSFTPLQTNQPSLSNGSFDVSRPNGSGTAAFSWVVVGS